MMKKLGFGLLFSAWLPLAAANTPLPDFAPPAEGQQVVINIPQLRLFLFQDGKLLKSYNVAVGKSNTQTPLGEYKIGAKAYNPTWHVPLSIRKGPNGQRLTVPPGPNNPLGPVFVRMGDPKLGLGIHGTNAPSSVPGVRSHGCVRMQSPNALEFAKTVKTGADVAVIYQMASLNADDAGHLWLAAYRDPYGRKNLDRQALSQSMNAWAQSRGLNINRQRVAGILNQRSGRLSCITCTSAQAKVKGSLHALAWGAGSSELVQPFRIEVPVTPQQDEVVPEGTPVEVLTDTTPAPAEGTPLQPLPASSDEAVFNQLM